MRVPAQIDMVLLLTFLMNEPQRIKRANEDDDEEAPAGAEMRKRRVIVKSE